MKRVVSVVGLAMVPSIPGNNRVLEVADGPVNVEERLPNGKKQSLAFGYALNVPSVNAEYWAFAPYVNFPLQGTLEFNLLPMPSPPLATEGEVLTWLESEVPGGNYVHLDKEALTSWPTGDTMDFMLLDLNDVVIGFWTVRTVGNVTYEAGILDAGQSNKFPLTESVLASAYPGNPFGTTGSPQAAMTAEMNRLGMTTTTYTTLKMPIRYEGPLPTPPALAGNRLAKGQEKHGDILGKS